MYTNDSEVPLRDVLRSIKEKENAAIASIDVKKATSEQLREYLAEVCLTLIVTEYIPMISRN